MDNLKSKITRLSEKIHKEIVTVRRYLHQHPELSFQEYKTSSFIGSQLDKMKIPKTKMAENGWVGVITGEKSSDSVIALRADFDALPITELNDIDFKSVNPGIMHACGHDFHTSSLLGVAKILSEMKTEFGGTIKLIFQPAEEKIPGGALKMIKEGALKKPKPHAVIGQHVRPDIESGKVGFCSGNFMASMDEIFVSVYGKGGHSATPHQNIDPVLIASHIIVALQQIVSRNIDPKFPSVLSFGKVIANGSTNVTPDVVLMEGTFRTMNEKWRDIAHTKMKKMAKGISEAMGGNCDFTIQRGYPLLTNKKKLTEDVKAFAKDYLGEENVIDIDIWMASEDFAYYAQISDACFYMLGIKNEVKGITSSLHTATFDVDENALKWSTGLMAYMAIKQMGN